MPRDVLVVHQFMSPGSPQDRQRGHMYLPEFVKAGMTARFMGRQPLPGTLLSRLPAGAARRVGTSLEYRSAARALAAALTLVNDRRIVEASRRADAVLLIKTDSPDLVRRIRRVSHARIVYDLADVRTGHAPALMARVEAIVRMADAVTCDNGPTLELARRWGATVHRWPSASYIEAFDAVRHLSTRGRDGRVRIGWIGTLSTSSNLYLILESLEDLFRSRTDLELHLVGIPRDHDLLTRFEEARLTVRPTYGEEGMISEVLGMDVGLFPMHDVTDNALHGVTKALIYMAGGAATIASPVGDAGDLIKDGENGLLASGRAEWTEKLARLVSDPQWRAELAAGGLRTARCYTLERCFSALRPALGT